MPRFGDFLQGIPQVGPIAPPSITPPSFEEPLPELQRPDFLGMATRGQSIIPSMEPMQPPEGGGRGSAFFGNSVPMPGLMDRLQDVAKIGSALGLWSQNKRRRLSGGQIGTYNAPQFDPRSLTQLTGGGLLGSFLGGGS